MLGSWMGHLVGEESLGDPEKSTELDHGNESLVLEREN